MPTTHSLVAGVESWADRTPDATAVVEGTRRATYGELRDSARALAGALDAAATTRGERIAYIGRNSVEQVELTTAAAMLGAVLVPVNWRLSAGEIAALITHMDARIVVAQDSLLDLARQAVAQATGERQVIVIGDGASDAETGYAAWKEAATPIEPEAFADLADDEVAAQLYTSGTSGTPKGVMLSCAGLRATVDLLADIWQLDTDAVLMPVLPWFHVGGIGAAAGALFAGGSIVVQNELTGGHIIEAIERHGVTSMVLAPIMIQGILNHPEARTRDLSSLRLVSYGASPISPSLLREFLDLLPRCTIVQIYGLTETWGTVTLLDGTAHHDSEHPERLQSAGRPITHAAIRLVDPITHGECAPGEVGEVWVRYVGNMLGYHKQPELTEDVLVDGWLRTNDLGWQDDGGFLFLGDRVGDMIVSGGENIFPSEVEAVIASHPGVAEVGIVGVPDPTWGETPRAFVVPAAGVQVDPLEIIDFTRQRLAHYKCPTSVVLTDSLPRNPSGKLLRRVLRTPSRLPSTPSTGNPGPVVPERNTRV